MLGRLQAFVVLQPLIGGPVDTRQVQMPRRHVGPLS